jgi:hypothetical protein
VTESIFCTALNTFFMLYKLIITTEVAYTSLNVKKNTDLTTALIPGSLNL